MNRDALIRNLNNSQSQQWDVIIIGGGATGAAGDRFLSGGRYRGQEGRTDQLRDGPEVCG